MSDSSDDLERLSREQLILKARVLGVERAELMTRVELRDEIVRRSEPDPVQQRRARGFLGVARDLVASVVEAGLNLPDAAAAIRGEGAREDWKGPPPVATVTLAEIYATQGHLERALRMLDEVIAKEPDHDPARALRERLAASEGSGGSPRKRLKINLAESSPLDTSPSEADSDLDQEIPDTVHAAAEPVRVVAEPAPATETVEKEPEFEFGAPPEAIAVEVAPPAEAIRVEATPTPAPVVESVQLESPAEIAAAMLGHAEPDTVDAAAEEIVSAHVEPTPIAPSEPCLLTLAFAGRRQVYWEMPKAAWQPLRARSPEGRALLRVVSFGASGGKVERQTLDITPHAEVGSSTLPGLASGAVVRAALGWEEHGRFTPFVLASDLGSDARPRTKSARFRPLPLVGGASAEAEQRALAYLKQLG